MMQSLLDPAILFFALGVFAGLVRSNLEMPAAISKFLSIYLLMALGLKGGFALAASGFTSNVATSLGLAVLLAIVVPLVGYALLRRVLSGFKAAAGAGPYGSVSAVTFVTATQYLESQHIAYGGHMAAAMALMESPAIILAVLLANALRQKQQAVAMATAAPPVVAMTGGGAATLGGHGPGNVSGKGGPHLSVGKILHEAFTDGTQLLVLGPITHATLALGLAWLVAVPAGDAVLLMVLAASASYIAVPAVVRYAIPEADPSLYVSLSLGLTFPLNIVLGIPLYTHVVQGLWAV